MLVLKRDTRVREAARVILQSPKAASRSWSLLPLRGIPDDHLRAIPDLLALEAAGGVQLGDIIEVHRVAQELAVVFRIGGDFLQHQRELVPRAPQVRHHAAVTPDVGDVQRRHVQAGDEAVHALAADGAGFERSVENVRLTRAFEDACDLAAGLLTRRLEGGDVVGVKRLVVSKRSFVLGHLRVHGRRRDVGSASSGENRLDTSLRLPFPCRERQGESGAQAFGHGTVFLLAGQHADLEGRVHEPQLQEDVHRHLTRADDEDGFLGRVEVESALHVLDRLTTTGHGFGQGSEDGVDAGGNQVAQASRPVQFLHVGAAVPVGGRSGHVADSAAGVVTAGLAFDAGATGDARFHRNDVADLETGHAFTELGDDADGLVAEHDAGVAVGLGSVLACAGDVGVALAVAVGQHFHAHFARVGRSRVFELRGLELVGAGEPEGFAAAASVVAVGSMGGDCGLGHRFFPFVRMQRVARHLRWRGDEFALVVRDG